MEALNEIKSWLLHQPAKATANRLQLKQPHNQQVLFRGKNPDAKRAAAEQLATETGKVLIRVDLSNVVSKYIGETEKNLAAIFENVKKKNVILFFDEADALFGKRTEVKDSHDRYANQEVSYLLQKIEALEGLVIFSVNRKENLDAPFLRRLRVVAFDS